MLTTEVVTLVYNHTQHGIYLIIQFYPNFDIPGGHQPADQVGFTFQYHDILFVYCIENMNFGINYG